MKRREFMIKTSSAVLAAGLAPRVLLEGESAAAPASRVIEVFHEGCVRAERQVDTEAVGLMLRRGLQALAGKKKPWSKFLKPTDRVGLKINTLGRPRLFTHHELIQAVVNELTGYGIAENNIIVWDRWHKHMLDSNFVFNTGNSGVRCYPTEGGDEAANRFDPEAAYVSELDNPEYRKGGTVSRLSSIFTRECDKIINLAILKDHGSAGYTLCLKNLAFGLCDNNSRFHMPPHIGPFIADFCALPMVREKVVLHLIDGLEACYDQGPAPSSPDVIYPQRTLWLGTDPVALDTVGYRVIDEKRVAMGLPRLKDSRNSRGNLRPVDQVELAAAKGLGVCDPTRIRIERIDLSKG
jgi:uncharacterized protein (DUF362 family)